MDAEKKGFRYRLSNVLAWGGSLGAGFVMVLLVNIAARSADGRSIRGWEEPFFTGLAVYLGCAVVNYLIVSSLRLLPWKDIE